MTLIFGTDSGPAHTCGGTIYRYDVRDCTVLATCVGCNRHACQLTTMSQPNTVQEIRAIHERHSDAT